jgi:hypothetical protein
MCQTIVNSRRSRSKENHPTLSRGQVNFSLHVGNFRCRLCFTIGWSLRGKGNPSDIMTGSRTMRVSLSSSVFLVLLLSPVCFSQLPSSRCDSIGSALKDCVYLTKIEIAPEHVSTSEENLADRRVTLAAISQTTTESESDSGGTTIAPQPTRQEHFHWGRALSESATFLVIEQAYVVHTDFNWVVSENGIPFNHYWRDYMQSLSKWTHSGWNDGDPNWFGYVGHPIQGALTGFIQIQNDPQGEKLEFSKTKAYWWSRLKAGLWNAAYSTQWNLGPVSEVTVEKYGTKDRPPWNYNGSFPCSHHCLTGVGQIDIVMTPLGGTGWLIGEDFLDRKVVRRVEDDTQNRLLIDTVRVALNPIRGGANVLHGKPLWYRASRDVQGMSLVSGQKAAVSAKEISKTQIPDHGDVFFGYTHTGSSRCQAIFSGAAVVCDPLSAGSSNLNGWNAAVEKKYLRYFGVVADFSGLYGGVNQTNFLFGLRGGAPIGRLRPFAEALIGAVHASENGSAVPKSDTSFAEDLGVGIDFRLMRLLGWRFQADELKTGSPDFERRNLRLSSGLAVRF